MKAETAQGERIVVAMSGGVDSSLAAALLQDAGADVVGVFLHVWDYSRSDLSGRGSCCAAEDAYDARRVADKLGIPFYSLDVRGAFRQQVIDPFIADYEAGRTPNPCAQCNRFIKFGVLLDAAEKLQARYVATGHYVRRHDNNSGVRLFRGADHSKDQTYFLATTLRSQASRILFPVGHLSKSETRDLASQFNLPTAAKSESQDICFVPTGDRIGFLHEQGSTAGFISGDIVDRSGHRLGRHAGIAHFTMGQRRGLGLSDGPWIVVGIEGSRVMVDRPSSALIQGVRIGELSWIRRPEGEDDLTIKVRYRAPSASCVLTMEATTAEARFDVPQPPTAPGQVAAIYTGEELLGGGIIKGLL